MNSSPSDLDTLKTKLKATWMAGDFGVIAKSYETGAAQFVDRLNITPGDKVLDVACGTGNLSIPTAKCGANVIGVDIASNLIEQARAREPKGDHRTKRSGRAERGAHRGRKSRPCGLWYSPRLIVLTTFASVTSMTVSDDPGFSRLP